MKNHTTVNLIEKILINMLTTMYKGNNCTFDRKNIHKHADNYVQRK